MIGCNRAAMCSAESCRATQRVLNGAEPGRHSLQKTCGKLEACRGHLRGCRPGRHGDACTGGTLQVGQLHHEGLLQTQAP